MPNVVMFAGVLVCAGFGLRFVCFALTQAASPPLRTFKNEADLTGPDGSSPSGTGTSEFAVIVDRQTPQPACQAAKSGPRLMARPRGAVAKPPA